MDLSAGKLIQIKGFDLFKQRCIIKFLSYYKFLFLIRKMASTTEQTVVENEVEQIGMLNGVEDFYEGITVEIKEHMDSHVFIPILRASISKWKNQVLD